MIGLFIVLSNDAASGMRCLKLAASNHAHIGLYIIVSHLKDDIIYIYQGGYVSVSVCSSVCKHDYSTSYG